LIKIAAESSDLKAALKTYFHPKNKSPNSPESPPNTSQFILQFEKQQENRDYLRKNIEKWAGDPQSFFGIHKSSSDSSIAVCIKRFFSAIDNVENGKLLGRIRSRILLAALSDLRDLVETELELREETGVHHESVANDIIFENCYRAGTLSEVEIKRERENLARRTRAGEKYSQFPSGMLFLCGDVKSSTMLVQPL
jgi:hypothetical protein